MSLLLLFEGSSPGTLIDFREVLAGLYAKLNATGAGDLIYWTDAELYQWLDEASKRLARTIGCFVERDASIAIALGVPSYTLPARSLDTIHASIAGVSLYPNNVQEVEALDSAWVETQGPTNSFLNDYLGTLSVGLYPSPDASVVGNLALILHRFAATIDSGNYLLSAPAGIAEYFSWWVLSEARRKQSDAAMPEVADHFAKRVVWLEGVLAGYYGSAQ